MNLLQHYTGQYGPAMGDAGMGHPRDGSRFPLDFAAGYMNPGGFQAHTGGIVPPHMQPMPNMHANTGGGLPAMAQGFPSAQTGGPGQMMPAMPSVNTGGGMPPMQFHANTGGGFQPQQMNQGGNGLAGMFRGFSPYGRQYMR